MLSGKKASERVRMKVGDYVAVKVRKTEFFFNTSGHFLRSAGDY